MIDRIYITKEMRERAIIESKKIGPCLTHHFKVDHSSSSETDLMGVLGEFAGYTYLGVDWRKNIREKYYEVDNGDIVIDSHVIDFKTESVPMEYAAKIINKTINDNEPYGRRLINKGQFNSLSKYDIIYFGMFIRNQPDYWYSIGCIDTHTIISDYKPTSSRPDGGKYPSPGSPVPTSILRSFKTISNETTM